MQPSQQPTSAQLYLFWPNPTPRGFFAKHPIVFNPTMGEAARWQHLGCRPRQDSHHCSRRPTRPPAPPRQTLAPPISPLSLDSLRETLTYMLTVGLATSCPRRSSPPPAPASSLGASPRRQDHARRRNRPVALGIDVARPSSPRPAATSVVVPGAARPPAPSPTSSSAPW
jgi:hypothetical protein